MKQDSPLRKKQNYVATEKHFSAIIERATAPRRQSLEAGRRSEDAAFEAPKDSTPQPITDAAKGLITGLGIVAAVFAMVMLFLGLGIVAAVFAMVMLFLGGDPLWYAIFAVLCLFGWLWLDAVNDE